MLLHYGVVELVQLIFTLPNLVVKIVDLAVHASHAMLVHIVT